MDTSSDDQVNLAVSYKVAADRVKKHKLPKWFRQHYSDPVGDGEIDRIIAEYGFPRTARDPLLTLALSLDLALLEPRRPSTRTVQRDVTSLKLHLKRSDELIARLERCNAHGFGPEVVQLANWTFEIREGPSEILRRDMGGFLRLLAALEPPGVRAGQRPTLVAWAQRLLDSIVGEYVPRLSLAKQTELSEALLGPVREHHGHKSRVEPDRSRHRDLVRRQSRLRKIGQKSAASCATRPPKK